MATVMITKSDPLPPPLGSIAVNNTFGCPEGKSCVARSRNALMVASSNT